ncbi:hypothetical protein G6F35_013684 [Rhizopus arrhizus]|nr:hypothetical protein G6F35_013684 [Rhizopus arrhizus]
MLDGDLAAGITIGTPHAPQARVRPATDERLFRAGTAESNQGPATRNELLVGEGIARLRRFAIQCRLKPGHLSNHMFVAHRGEITGQRELGGVLAVQGVGVQAVAMPGVLQCGTLQFQRGAGCRGGRSRQQCLRQCGRGAGTEALVGVGAYATRRHRALSVGRIFGFGARGQFNHAHDLGGGGRIDEAGVTELDQCGVHLGEARIGGQQQHRGGRLLHDRIGLAIRGEQRAVGQVQAEPAQRVGRCAVVADGDVHAR